MARRRDGRELFEIFKEMKADSKAGAAPERAFAQPRGKGPSGQMIHTLRLGDRRQVEIFMSLAWVYGISFFVFLALVAAFVLGRRTAPAPEPVVTVKAGEDFAAESAAVSRPPSPAEPESSVSSEETEAAGSAAPAAASPPAAAAETPPAVGSVGLYTLRVVTYGNSAKNRILADEFVAWLKQQGFEDVAVVQGKSGRNIYVTIGRFETKEDPAALELQRRVRALTYKGDSLNPAYLQNVNTL